MTTKYQKRINKLRETMQTSNTVPKKFRGPYIRWSDGGGSTATEDPFEEIRASLMARFGTTEGAEFVTIGWKGSFE
jgi:hypothetical protein